MLLIAFHETLIHCFTNIGLAIAVRVFRIEDFGSHRDNHASSPAMNACRKRKVIEERRGFVVDAVFVGVFEHLHATSVAISLRRDEPCSVRFIRRCSVVSCRIFR